MSNNYGFEIDDLLVSEKSEYDKNNNVVSTQEIWAKVVGADYSSGQSTVEIVKGLSFIDTEDYTNGMEMLKIGNASNPARQKNLEIAVVGSQATAMILRRGIDDFSKRYSGSQVGSVFGDLSPEYDDLLQPQGEGILTDNLYARGTFALGDATSLTVGKGVWLNHDRSTGKGEVRFGDPATYYLELNQNYDLKIKPKTFELNTGGLSIDSTTEQIKLGQAVDFTLGDGIFIGNDGGTYKLRVGQSTSSDSKNRMIYDGDELAIYDKDNVKVFSNTSASNVNLSGWTLSASEISNGNIHIDSTGEISAYDGVVNYWKLAGDGSGYVARQNLTWDANGNVTVAGTINATGGTFTGYVSAGGMRFGAVVDGSNNGIYLDANNYWYDSGIVSHYADANNYFQFDGSKMVWKSANSELKADGTMVMTNADITGSITATIGQISIFGIDADAISTGGYNTFGTLYFGNSGLSISNVFSVNSSGVLTATGVDLGGNIDVESGTFGTVDITGVLTIQSGGQIKAGTASNYVTVKDTGIQGISATLGTVFDLPSDGSAPTFSSGIIREAVFEIYTSGVIRTSDTVGSGGANSAGVLMNGAGIYAIGANQTSTTANVQILASGEVYLNNATISWSGVNVPVKDDLGSWVTYIGEDGIYTGTLTATQVNAVDINAGSITVGTLTSIEINNGTGTFHVDSAGNLTATSADITGTITATSGEIAIFNIDANAIYTGAYNTSGTLYFGNSGLSLSNNFVVSSSGYLTASGANISGSITATSGSIDGVLAVNSYMTAGNSRFGKNAITTNWDGLYISANDYWADVSGTTEFQVGGSSGIYYQTGSNILLGTNVEVQGGISIASGTFAVNLSGEVTATAGSIGGYTLASNALHNRSSFNPETVDSATYSSGVVTIGTLTTHNYSVGDWVTISGVSGMTDLNCSHKITEVPNNTSFKVSLTTAQSYTSGGQIDDYYGLTITSQGNIVHNGFSVSGTGNNVRVYIGNQSKYIHWDSSNLEIGGNITSTATITGGTIASATFTGGTFNGATFSGTNASIENTLQFHDSNNPTATVLTNLYAVTTATKKYFWITGQEYLELNSPTIVSGYMNATSFRLGGVEIIGSNGYIKPTVGYKSVSGDAGITSDTTTEKSIGDIQYASNGTTLQYKLKTTTIKNGIITGISFGSWTNVPVAQA